MHDLHSFTNRWRFPPTIKELADLLGISDPSLRGQVNQLVRKGYVKQELRKVRGLTVLWEPTDEVLELRAVPIIGILDNCPLYEYENLRAWTFGL